jgi:hypothetical protein
MSNAISNGANGNGHGGFTAGPAQPMLDGIEPWTKRSGESAQAFEAWVAYRNMGFSGTYTRVAEQLGKHIKLIERWVSLANS